MWLYATFVSHLFDFKLAFCPDCGHGSRACLSSIEFVLEYACIKHILKFTSIELVPKCASAASNLS